MLKRQSRGEKVSHQRASAQAGVSASPSARRRLLLLLAGLVLILAVVWLLGGLAAVPRGMAERSLSLRDFAGAWWWTEVAGWLSYHDPASALLAARVARTQGDADRLDKELRRAARWGADRRLLRREELLALAQSGQLDDIEAELMQHFAEGGVDGAEISDAYANGLAINARFDDALTVLENWQQDFPTDPRPEYRLGRIKEHLEQYADAEAAYRRSLTKSAGFAPARFSLGRVLLHERRAEEAVEVFRSCLNCPHPQAVLVELAIALKSLGRADEARPLLQQVLAADPERLRASYKALDEQPEGFKAAAEYGKLEADAGNFAIAEPWLAKALAANPLDLVTRYSLAVSLRGQGKHAEAKEHFDRVAAGREAMDKAGAFSSRIKANPEDLEARYLLGKAILQHESERTGLYWLRSIFTFDPHYAPAHELLADHFAAKTTQVPYYSRLADYHRRMAAASRQATPP
jgi:tetratricopeptide (TPR) repeat protein